MFIMHSLKINLVYLHRFIAFKLPAGTGTNSASSDGTSYVYRLSSNVVSWLASDKSIDDPDSLPGRTLGLLYDQSMVRV